MILDKFLPEGFCVLDYLEVQETYKPMIVGLGLKGICNPITMSVSLTLLWL